MMMIIVIILIIIIIIIVSIIANRDVRVPWEICERTMVDCQLKKKQRNFSQNTVVVVLVGSNRNCSIKLVEVVVVGFKFLCKVEFYIQRYL